MHSCASSLILALLYFIGSTHDSHGYLLNTWSAQDLALLGASVYGSKCYLIPDNLTLCYGIGYDRMRLPNHLNHDTMSETIAQSQIWLALTRTNCHDDLRVFLCSMYAPVCLTDATKLKPCRSLCENVRQSCLPRMQAVGYEWPDILRCDQFPQGNQVCVPLRPHNKAACSPCRQAVTYENIISSHCMASVVFKGRIVSHHNRASRIHLALHRKKKFYKSDGLSRAQRRSLSVHINKVNGCTCNQVTRDRPQDKWLIMGRRISNDSDQVEVTFMVSWQRRNRAFKRAVRSIRRHKSICTFLPSGSANKRGNTRENKNKRKKKKKKKRTRNGRRRQNGRRRRIRIEHQQGGNRRRGRHQSSSSRRRGRNDGSRRGRQPQRRRNGRRNGSSGQQRGGPGPANATQGYWA